jgi:hypothetical protein
MCLPVGYLLGLVFGMTFCVLFPKVHVFVTYIHLIAKSLSGSKWKNMEAKTEKGSGK